MKFTIRNQANIANKYIRFSKWKIRNLTKYTKLLYAEIYIKKVSMSAQTYRATVKLGVPGPDIVVSSESDNLNALWSELTTKMKRQMRKFNKKRNSRR